LGAITKVAAGFAGGGLQRFKPFGSRWIAIGEQPQREIIMRLKVRYLTRQRHRGETKDEKRRTSPMRLHG